jgi:hypothetical protein
MDKNVAIVVAGAQGSEVRDVAIKAGSTSRDVLSTLQLDGYVLSKADGRLFGPGDNVFQAVEEGEKLYASTEAGVGR